MQDEISSIPYSKRESRKLFSRIGLAFAVFMLVTTLFQVAISILIGRGFWNLGENAFDKTMVLSMAMMYLAGFPAFLLVIRRIPAVGITGGEVWSIWKLGAAFIISMGMVYAGNIIGQLLMLIVSLFSGEPMYNNLEQIVSNMNIWISILLLVILAPIMEELIFRKILISRIIQYGERVSIVVSGIMFGLVHGNFYQFFYACALGMVFAYIYIKTGKLRYPIAFHMIINTIGSVIPMLILRTMERNLLVGTLLLGTMGLFNIGFIIMGIVLLICFRKEIVLRAGQVIIPKGSGFLAIFMNVGMMAFFLVCTLMFTAG